MATGARVYNSQGNIAVTSGSYTNVNYSGERWDYGGCHYNGTDPHILKAPTKGVYVITGYVTWDDNADGLRILSIKANGSTYIAMAVRYPLAVGLSTAQNVATLWELNSADYVSLEVLQNSGVTLDILSAEFAMHLVEAT